MIQKQPLEWNQENVAAKGAITCQNVSDEASTLGLLFWLRIPFWWVAMSKESDQSRSLFRILHVLNLMPVYRVYLVLYQASSLNMTVLKFAFFLHSNQLHLFAHKAQTRPKNKKNKIKEIAKFCHKFCICNLGHLCEPLSKSLSFLKSIFLAHAKSIKFIFTSPNMGCSNSGENVLQNIISSSQWNLAPNFAWNVDFGCKIFLNGLVFDSSPDTNILCANIRFTCF